MKRLVSHLERIGFIYNPDSKTYVNGLKEVSIKKTNRPCEYLVCFRYSDFLKHSLIIHYANRVNGFQPTLTRAIYKSINDCNDFFCI